MVKAWGACRLPGADGFGWWRSSIEPNVRALPAQPAGRRHQPGRIEELIRMHIPTWRLTLTGGAIVLLAVAGIGLAVGAAAPAPPPPDALMAVSTTAVSTSGPDASSRPIRGEPDREVARDRLEQAHAWRGVRWLRAARHLVHAELTLTGREDELIVLAFDHGSVGAVGGGLLTIEEAGGGSETVSIDDATIVYVGRQDGRLDDLTVGDEVFVQSRVEGGTTLAKRILIVPSTDG
jgi:hypothetical protein